MVIVSDPNIQSATVMLNISSARKHFEKTLMLSTSNTAGAVL
jgi:hypothetical protein